MNAASIHEDFNRKDEIKGSSDRSFGIVFTLFFLLVAFWPTAHHHPIRWWSAGLSAAFLLAALLWPSLLHPLNRLWTGLAVLLNRIVTPIVTGVLFYVVVTPISILFRLQGKDTLRLSADTGASTYWIERDPKGPPPESMSNQF